MATATKSLEKGIRELTYNNEDGSKVVKYQVRIHTKELPNFNYFAYKPEFLKSLLENWWNSRNSPRRRGNNPIDMKNNNTYVSSLGVIVNTLAIDWAKQDWQEKLMPISVQQNIQKHGKRGKGFVRDFVLFKAYHTLKE